MELPLLKTFDSRLIAGRRAKPPAPSKRYTWSPAKKSDCGCSWSDKGYVCTDQTSDSRITQAGDIENGYFLRTEGEKLLLERNWGERASWKPRELYEKKNL